MRIHCFFVSLFLTVPSLGVGLQPNNILASGESWSIAVPAPGPTHADINGDGIVDGADLGVFIASWATTAPEADIDFDGVVSGGDLGLLLVAWK